MLLELFVYMYLSLQVTLVRDTVDPKSKRRKDEKIWKEEEEEDEEV